jgi:HPt (histidine-containing phosphotransfer) domain-containing protein
MAGTRPHKEESCSAIGGAAMAAVYEVLILGGHRLRDQPGPIMSTLHADAVDLEHLDRYTGGDRAINEEVLRLFQSQCGEMTANLEAAAAAGADAKSWRLITHTLKGAARGIGADALADAAAEAEKVAIADTAAVGSAVERIEARLRAVQLFIARFLG